MYAVALTSEAAELRYGGIDKDILLLLPEENDALRALEHDVTFSVYSVKQLKIIEKACKILKKQAKIHIKYNSGMNRLGCNLHELHELTERANNSDNIIISGVYSHLSEPDCALKTMRQYDSFLLAQNYVKRINRNVISHLAASGGVLAGKKYCFDMVRAGLMLYGYTPFKSDKIKLKPALSIETDIIMRRSLKQGDDFLYGCYKCTDSFEADIIRLGYADGLLRSSKMNLANNRCMDVSGVPIKRNSGGFLQGGTTPDSFLGTVKDNIFKIDDFDAVARAQNTIVYEVLCNITKRAELIYIN